MKGVASTLDQTDPKPQQLKEAPKEKVDFLDLMKAIASYLVVIYHYNVIDVDVIRRAGPLQFVNYYVTAFLPIAVPIFFLTNGALLLNKRSVDLKKHCYKILNFVVLVIIWAVLSYLIIAWLRNHPIELRELVKSTYFFKQGWTNHLWFLQGLTVVYIFFPILYSAYHHHPAHLYFFFIVAAILTLGNTLLGNAATVFSYLTGMFYNRDFHTFNFFSGFNAFQGLYGYSFVYFILGGLLMRNREKLTSRRLRAIAVVIILLATGMQCLYAVAESRREGEIFDIVWHGHDTVFSLLIVLGLFVLALPYKHRGFVGKIIAMAGQNTLGVYFLHVLVAEAISNILFSFS
ncbi:MAG TPA: acyltransferase, partial [Chryseosolibacter sp.]|nr:acyltransferase [Chryseosolibacter sp.]